MGIASLVAANENEKRTGMKNSRARRIRTSPAASEWLAQPGSGATAAAPYRRARARHPPAGAQRAKDAAPVQLCEQRKLRGTGVTATVSCPGATATEFAAVAGNERSRLFRMGAASPQQVAKEGYRAMMAGKPIVVHGLKNKFAVQALRVSSRAAVRVIAASLNPAPARAQH